MENFFSHYLLFLIQTITITGAILIVVLGILGFIFSQRNKASAVPELVITDLSQQYRDLKNKIQQEILDKNSLRKLKNDLKKSSKLSAKQNLPKLFVIDFCGDVRASTVNQLADQISAIKLVASEQDEVLLRLESGGGMMHAYGLAAAELTRLKENKIKLIVAVDKVAASGGYMMACVADKIIAAPFAILGSIGVIAQLPNFYRWLEKHDIDVEEHMAGEDKRTLTMLGENTPEKRAKFVEYLADAHVLFKNFVQMQRKQVEIEKISTGKHWFGMEALDLKLVDDIMTSQEYLLQVYAERKIVALSYPKKKGLAQKFQQCTKMLANYFGIGGM